MLGSVARTATRLRSARKAAQRLHTTPPAVVDRFPLYRPPPPAPLPASSSSSSSSPSRRTADSLADLPTEAELRRAQKLALTEDATSSLPEFDETFLESFYRDVLRASPDYEAEPLALAAPRMGADERRNVLARVEARVLGVEQAQGGPSRPSDPSALPATAQTHRRLAVALASVAVPDGRVPLGVMNKTEWNALADEFLEREDNPRSVEFVLEIMTRHGVQPDQSVVEGVVERFAALGQASEVARIIGELEAGEYSLSDRIYESHIRAHLSTAKPRVQAAIAALASAEDAGRPYPQSAYGALLTHLTAPSPSTHTNAHTRALAWDVFAHMRLAAHPTPSAAVYGAMLRACAAGGEPERARDLWLEMEAGDVRPSRAEYDAVIRALGTRGDYLEAFDILRQLVAKHEAVVAAGGEGASTRWLPTAQTWVALLEGTKRAGDLSRARWVVAEMVRYAGLGPDWAANEEILASVFMTYAAWKPPVVRSTVKAVGVAISRSDSTRTPIDKTEDRPGLLKSTESERDDVLAAPQTSADAVAEAASLFQNVIHDLSLPPSSVDPQANPFASVRLTTRLINAYLSVQLAHAPLAAAREVFDKTWAALAAMRIRPNAWSYLAVLERCARGGQPAGDRPVAREWAEEVWAAYRAYADAAERAVPGKSGDDLAPAPAEAAPSLGVGVVDDRRRRWLAGLGPRQVERAWVALIRLRAQDPTASSADASDGAGGALALLRAFHARHPPAALLASYRPALPDTLAHAPAVPGSLRIRLSDASTTQEADVPPHIAWADVDVVHARLARAERRRELAELNWMCTGYQRALATRRKWRLAGAGVGRERRRLRRRAEKPAETAETVAPGTPGAVPAPAAEDADLGDGWREGGHGAGGIEHDLEQAMG